MHFVNLRFPQDLASISDSAARPGACRKPPGALYVESGKESVLSLPFVVRCVRTSPSRGGDAPRTALSPAQKDLPRPEVAFAAAVLRADQERGSSSVAVIGFRRC